MKKGLIITIAVVAVLAIGLYSLYSYAASLKTEGVALEAGLSAQYSSDQNEYSNYGAALVEQLGVTGEKADRLKETIVAYVSGRKVEGSGKLLNAVQEAVPNLEGLNTYDKIVEYIQTGREKFKNKQETMLAKIAAYEVWKDSGIIRPKFISFLGFPTNSLRAQIGKDAVYGQAALERMRVIVTTSDSQKAFETGTDTPFVTPKKK